VVLPWDLRARALGLIGLLAAGLICLGVAASAAAGATYNEHLVGAEIPPISSTLGTFAGVATGQMPMAWQARIVHDPLGSATTVRITGGAFSMRPSPWRKLVGKVTGGSVSVVDRGSGCRNQTYRVKATLTIGSFDGMLTHHRRVLLGNCLIYSASIAGNAVITV